MWRGRNRLEFPDALYGISPRHSRIAAELIFHPAQKFGNISESNRVCIDEGQD